MAKSLAKSLFFFLLFIGVSAQAAAQVRPPQPPMPIDCRGILMSPNDVEWNWPSTHEPTSFAAVMTAIRADWKQNIIFGRTEKTPLPWPGPSTPNTLQPLWNFEKSLATPELVSAHEKNDPQGVLDLYSKFYLSIGAEQARRMMGHSIEMTQILTQLYRLRDDLAAEKDLTRLSRDISHIAQNLLSFSPKIMMDTNSFAPYQFLAGGRFDWPANGRPAHFDDIVTGMHLAITEAYSPSVQPQARGQDAHSVLRDRLIATLNLSVESGKRYLLRSASFVAIRAKAQFLARYVTDRRPLQNPEKAALADVQKLIQQIEEWRTGKMRW